MIKVNRDPRLPRPHLGCWTNQVWLRRYKCIAMQIARENPEYREEELRRQRLARAGKIPWKRKGRDHERANGIRFSTNNLFL